MVETLSRLNIEIFVKNLYRMSTIAFCLAGRGVARNLLRGTKEGRKSPSGVQAQSPGESHGSEALRSWKHMKIFDWTKLYRHKWRTNQSLIIFWKVWLYFEKISSYEGGTCTHIPRGHTPMSPLHGYATAGGTFYYKPPCTNNLKPWFIYLGIVKIGLH